MVIPIYCINRDPLRQRPYWLGRICLSFLTLLLLIPYQEGFGQDADIERLQQLDSKARKDTSDLAAMLSITADLSARNADTALFFLERIKTHAEEKRYYEGLVEYCTQILAVYMRKNQFNEAAQIIQRVYDTHERRLTVDQQVAIKALRATALNKASRMDEALAIMDEILPLAKATHRQAQIYFEYGSANHRKGNHKEAISAYLASLKRYQSLADSANATIVLNGLGNLYVDLKDASQSISYYQQALRYVEQSEDLKSRAMIYSNLGTAYKQLDSNEVALSYYTKGLELAQTLNEPVTIAQNLMNIGNVQKNMQRFDKAMESYRASIKKSYASGIKYGIMINHVNIGLLHQMQGNYKDAKRAYDSAMVYIKLLQLPFEEARIHEHYAYLYEGMGQYKAAIDHHKTFHELREKFLNEENQRAVAELQVVYQTELKDQEILLINQQFQEKKAQNRALISVIVLVVLAAGFAIFFLIYRNRTLRELYDRNMELTNTVNFPRPKPEEYLNEEENTDYNLQLLFTQILNLLQDEHIYKDPNLTIGKIVERTKTNEKYVSAAIAKHAKMNYSNFINFYRINEAKGLIHESEHNTTLNEVMYACGFNSRTTFYDSFNKFVGMSPKQFKQMAKSAQVRTMVSLVDA